MILSVPFSKGGWGCHSFSRFLVSLIFSRSVFSLSIQIEFKTVYPKGLLLLSGNFKKGDIVAAYLSNGRLIFARKCGYGRVFEIYNKPLDDGLWHEVSE